MADPKSQDLLEILKRDATIPVPTTQDQINSRHNAEKVLGPDENIFRIDWVGDYMSFPLHKNLKNVIVGRTEDNDHSTPWQRRLKF
jgi:histone deacetylase complex regulatory component SIN3